MERGQHSVDVEPHIDSLPVLGIIRGAATASPKKQHVSVRRDTHSGLTDYG